MINFHKLAEPPGEVYNYFNETASAQYRLVFGYITDYQFFCALNAIYDDATFDYYEQLEQGGRI